MNVIYIVNGLGFAEGVCLGGSDKRVVEIGKRLLRKAEVNVVTTTTGYKVLKKEGLSAKYTVISPLLPWLSKIERISFGRAFSYILEILQCFSLKTRVRGYGLVYASSDFVCDTIPAWIFKRRNPDLKLVAIVHHLIDVPWRRKGGTAANVLNYISQHISFRLMKRNADLILVYETPEGRRIKEYLCKMGFPRQKIGIVANGVDFSFAQQIPEQNKVFDACFVGGLRPSKGIFDLVPIWKKVCSEISNAKIAIVGGGAVKYNEVIRRQIKEHNLIGNVVIIGPLSGEALFKLIKSSKIFVFPSYEEGWGIAVCEAMACGLPVVAYDLPAYEVFGNAITKVPLGRVESFAEAILKLLADEARRKEASDKALRVASKFDWDKIAELELSILSTLFSKYPRL